ncbi:hypothetical protein [Enterococcus termitis]|uniref:Uncharacterized protein n=1 Tax=Enterococcus termitis TaxID=332950 RepID=A0A1E5GD63_9ENTE|nr:hypothetical protein [Enterococcus termitis]OEG10591.1 hypothetical protein BCR25_08980 [Enterococcus termitis]
MKHLYKTMMFETSLYYGLLAIVLPLIYAVTYHVTFISVFNTEWLAVTLFLYPIILLLSTIRYGYSRMRKASHL